jgi:hypothetical protein
MEFTLRRLKGFAAYLSVGGLNGWERVPQVKLKMRFRLEAPATFPVGS